MNSKYQTWCSASLPRSRRSLVSALLSTRDRLARVMLYLAIVLSFLAAGELAAQADTTQARDRGLAWLTTHQKADGSWRSTPGTEFAATATAVDAFGNAGLKNFSYTRGVAWLNNASAPSVDSLSRQISALAGAQVKVDSLVFTLFQWRNRLRAWGAYEAFETSFPDTPLALSAIRNSGFTYVNWPDALCSILLAQKTGAAAVHGSWSNILPGTNAPVSAISSSILATTYNIGEIAAIKDTESLSSMDCLTSAGTSTFDLQTAIDNGINWLLTQKQKADSGFGNDSASTVFETALVYDLLRSLRPTDAATTNALNYLISTQGGDGSWNGDAFQTAFVLKALPAPSQPYTDTDGDGLPNAIETYVGTDPNQFDTRGLGTIGSDPAAPPNRTVYFRPSQNAAAMVLAGGVETGGLARGPLFQLFNSAGALQLTRFALNADFTTDFAFLRGNLDADPEEEILVGGRETRGEARGPAFQIWDGDGAWKLDRLVLNADFTNVAFSLANVSTHGILVCGDETEGLGRGPAFEIWDGDGTWKLTRFGLNADFTENRCFGVNTAAVTGDEIVIAGTETAGPARGPAFQIWDNNGNPLVTQFVLNPDFTGTTFSKIDINNDGLDEILVVGTETRGLHRGPALQLFDKDANLLLTQFVLNSDFTEVRAFAANTAGGPAPQIVVTGRWSDGLAHGPLFQIFSTNGSLLHSQNVLNPDFTEVTFSKIDIDNDGVDEILVVGRETQGLQRGPAFQIFRRDGDWRLVVTLFVLNPDFTNISPFFVDLNGDGHQDVGIAGIETRGLLRSPAYQIFNSTDWSLLQTQFVLNSDF